MKKSKRRFMEFEIRKNWFVLIEVDDADDGEIGFWLRHEDYGIMDYTIGLMKQDIIKKLKEENLDMKEFKANDLNYDNDNSVIEFSNIFLDNLIAKDIEN